MKIEFVNTEALLNEFNSDSPFKDACLLIQGTSTFEFESLSISKMKNNFNNRNGFSLNKIISIKKDSGNFEPTIFEASMTDEFLFNDSIYDFQKQMNPLEKPENISKQLELINSKIKSYNNTDCDIPLIETKYTS